MTIPKHLMEAKICNKETCAEVEQLNSLVNSCQEEIRTLKEELEKKNKKYWQRKCSEYHSIIVLFERWLNSEIKRIEKLQNDTKNVKPYGQEFNNYVLIIDTYNYALNKLEELKEKYTDEQ